MTQAGRESHREAFEERTTSVAEKSVELCGLLIEVNLTPEIPE